MFSIGNTQAPSPFLLETWIGADRRPQTCLRAFAGPLQASVYLSGGSGTMHWKSELSALQYTPDQLYASGGCFLLPDGLWRHWAQ
jgi:hypothetical protein